MIIKKLSLENIRSYEKLDLVFPQGSVLLSGDIGAGKTSILLGLQFALFGLQPGQKGTSILRQGTDMAFAKLEIEIDGTEILLERSIKKSSNGSITQDLNRITIDGNPEEISTSEMKNRVISLLNYPKEFAKKSNLLYKYTVYTPQEEMKEIIQERPEVRLDTLRHIFGIDRYKRIKDNAQIFLQKIKEEIRIKEILSSELNLLKEKLNQINETKIALARETNNLEIQQKNLETEKSNAEQRLSSIQTKIDEKRKIESEIERLNALIQGKQTLEERLRKEIAIMQKQTQEKIDFSEPLLKSTIDLLTKHQNSLEEKNQSYLEINSKISVLESKKETPFEIKEKILSIDNCPLCFQTVSQEHKDKIAKRTQFEIEDINRELEQKLQERERIIKEIEQEKELIRGYETDKTRLQQDKIKFEHQKSIETKIKSDAFILDRTSVEIQELKKQIEENTEKLSEFASYQVEFEMARDDFKKTAEVFRSGEIQLAEKKKELEILKSRLEELNTEISQKEKVREQMIYLRELQDWLQEKFISVINLTEKNVMTKLRKEFSDIFAEWFSMLVSDSLSVRLDESFTPIIQNQDYEIDYDFLSGGERTAVALAYRLSLNQVLNSLLSKIKTEGVVILDEPTDGFSGEQIDKMRDIFEQLNTEQMILVSHEQKIEGFVDHVIRVRKDGTSSVENI